ncbi:MAG TPA: hypothetical protein VGE83_02030 [Terracidiphilus sp.]|jgi:hypothetical protein
MNLSDRVASLNTPALTNGSGAAAILSAAIGAFALALLALAADKSATIKSLLVLYKPTGALSGVTTTAILIWLLAWGILEWRWRRKALALGRINIVAFALLALSFLLTFPPIADCL